MVEHDIPAEEREPVLEEPHKMREEKEEKGKEEEEGEEGGSGGDSKMGEDQLSQQSETAAAGTDSQPSYAGVSTFFSGIASMVQTTVSSKCRDKKSLVFDHCACTLCLL